MAIAVLGVRTRGSTQYTAVFRQAGATLIQVGNNFTAMTLTSATGTFNIGDTVTGGSSGATAVIKNVLVSGSTTTLFLNSIVGVFTNTSETVTATSGGSGTLTASTTTSPTEATLWVNPGILEFGASSNQNMPQDRVLEFGSVLLCVINNYIIRSTDYVNWSVVHTYTSPSDTPSTQCHTGLHVFYPSGTTPLLGVVYGGNGGSNETMRVTSTDGVTWTEAVVNPSNSLGGGGAMGVSREVVFNNTLFFFSSTNQSNGTQVCSWEPLTDAFQFLGNPATNNGPTCLDMITFQNTLLLIAVNSNNHVCLFNFAGGSFNLLLDLGVSGNTGGTSTEWALFDPLDGNLYAIVYENSPLWEMYKILYSGGSYTNGGEIDSTTLAGTGITTGLDGRWYIVTDDVTVPETPAVYLYYASSDAVGTSVQVMLWNGPTSAVSVIGTTSGIEVAIAHTRAGGGERIWGPNQPSILGQNSSTTIAGIVLTYTVYGGTTSGTVDVNNGSMNVVGAGTAFTTQLQPGQRVTFGSQFGTAYTVNTITDDTHIVLSANYTGTNNAATSLTICRNIAFYYSQESQAPSLQSTLASPSRGTLSGKQVNDVPADGVSQTVTWVVGPSGDNITNLTPTEPQPTVLA
jgi:hypothetical protein